MLINGDQKRVMSVLGLTNSLLCACQSDEEVGNRPLFYNSSINIIKKGFHVLFPFSSVALHEEFRVDPPSPLRASPTRVEKKSQL